MSALESPTWSLKSVLDRYGNLKGLRLWMPVEKLLTLRQSNILSTMPTNLAGALQISQSAGELSLQIHSESMGVACHTIYSMTNIKVVLTYLCSKVYSHF